ncbi:NAD(P)(+) transhydrogenase (Re/Si-specific) subunit beta [Peloplasma aerotolerans]|uniref:NAD(P) transhydrogenase subunit beta n=1 Tax=Peloplasma aerotolerans TaxID=3044389 RepID=A0AAW6UE99_9MOLU|nr:NAD(P)(+) transhydrogenase (Re/Si-specific) subunit beta [Mariniplasma sp. M4Ah]MDI6453766.1 NAD(P)(+) transhydrogenase (Re/Si-specific) subunit beta [Mariniplasma sp. M4Ah]
MIIDQNLADLKDIIVAVLYLISSIFFILGIKKLSKPKTASRGNSIGALGMLIATLTAFIDFGVIVNVTDGVIESSFQYWYILLAAILLGSIVGIWSALKVKMTGMPQMVAIFNGFGGGASFLVAGVYFGFEIASQSTLELPMLIATVLSGLIGAITLSGSFIAYAKLQGLKIIPDKPVSFKFDLYLKLILLAGLLGLGGLMVATPDTTLWYWIIVGGGLLLGILLVIGIGGADMPVVISLLNSYSGLAAAATGFVLNNIVLIIAGSLVGASGIILTSIMCKAMNRSLINVLFGGFGGAPTSITTDSIYEGKVTSTSPDEVAMILESAQRVVIVPGYGMAVARAATSVRLLTEALESNGVEVVFGIHPVAGRMPGHMNVLLAEENIPYEKLIELENINPTFANTDVVIVIGANDVVNPLAREKDSEIAGMPILDVDKARTCVVIKRSLSPGFAGIPNPLFANDNTLMLYGDGKKAVDELVKAYKDL